MKAWAWVWLGLLALLGWAPGLVLSYFIAFALALRPFGIVYYGLLAACLLLLVQVRKFFGLAGAERAWFTWAGGGALIAVWIGAYLGFGIQFGWL